MSYEPRVGEWVRVPLVFEDRRLLVIAISGKGPWANVTLELPIHDTWGQVVEHMTTTLHPTDLEAA